MRKIKMLRDQKGSENGTIVMEFNEGQTYMMEDSLAGVFIENKWAAEMDTPEALEIERKKAVAAREKELVDLMEACFVADLDSTQMTDKIATLEAYEITEDDFQEGFKEADKTKKKGIKDAKKSLTILIKKETAAAK